MGAEAAVTARRRHLMRDKASPASINQALAAVTLLYDHAGLRVAVKRARVSRPGEPDALTPAQQGAAERAATRRGARDAAILVVLLYAGAREEECARLDAEDIAITARGTIRLHGKGEGPLEEALAHHCSTPISPSRARRRRRLRLRTRPPSCR